jgi:preprotein translocase subunit SecG
MFTLFWLITGLFMFVCLILILLVLIQKGRGGGLSSAFGGSGGNTAFGSKTGDVLTWATSVIFALFVILAAVLNLVANRIGGNPQPVQGVTQLPTAPASNNPATPGH